MRRLGLRSGVDTAQRDAVRLERSGDQEHTLVELAQTYVSGDLMDVGIFWARGGSFVHCFGINNSLYNDSYYTIRPSAEERTISSPHCRANCGDVYY